MEELFTQNIASIVQSNRILYTPSTFARNSLLHLQEIGELKAIYPHVSSRSKLKSFLFFVVTNGAGSLEYDNTSFMLQQGNCVFIDCSKSYSHMTDEEDLWTLCWCHFYGPTLSYVYKKYCERGGGPVFNPKSIDSFMEVWSSLMKAASGSDYIRDMRINEELNKLLTLLMEQSWHPDNQDNLPPKKSLIGAIKEHLDLHFFEKITLDSLSSQFYINKYYLTKSFKEQYGVSINAYLLNLRITKAKQLLRFSDKSVEQIGLECGLGAAHYFSQKFKEVEGIPPSKYREQW